MSSAFIGHDKTTLMAFEMIATHSTSNLHVTEFESIKQSVLEERMQVPIKTYELSNPYHGLNQNAYFKPKTGQENRRERRKQLNKNKRK